MRSKKALLLCTRKQASKKLLSEKNTLFESLTGKLVDTISYIEEQRNYIKPLLGPNGDSRFLFRWKKQIRDDVKRSVYDKNANVFTFSDINVVYDLFASICIGLYTYWLYENPSLTAEQIAKLESYLIYILFIAK